MTSEMKLLMALCDALGFEVEVDSDYGEKVITREQTKELLFKQDELLAQGMVFKENDKGGLYFNDDELNVVMLIEPVSTFRLIKKKSK